MVNTASFTLRVFRYHKNNAQIKQESPGRILPLKPLFVPPLLAIAGSKPESPKLPRKTHPAFYEPCSRGTVNDPGRGFCCVVGRPPTFSRVIWGPIHNADSWARRQALNAFGGRGVPNTCTLTSPSRDPCAPVNRRTEQGADLSSPQMPWTPFRLSLRRPQPSPHEGSPERKNAFHEPIL